MADEGVVGYFGLEKYTVYKLARRGNIPCRKIGRHGRFRKETLDRWLDDSRPKR